MKKFTKGTLTSIVEDNDHRIAGYRANGWEEVSFKDTGKVPTEGAKQLSKALKDANDSEPKQGGKRNKALATDKKVNDAIKVNAAAAGQNEPVDDGLTGEGA